MRGMFYLFLSMVEHEDAQRKGIVMILYAIESEVYDRNVLHTLFSFHSKMNFFQSIPFRPISMHYCYNNPLVKPALSALQLLTGGHARVRSRFHCGAYCAKREKRRNECIYGCNLLVLGTHTHTLGSSLHYMTEY
jgi:hypothetical protein